MERRAATVAGAAGRPTVEANPNMPCVSTFAMGNKDFYDFLDDNPSMHSVANGSFGPLLGSSSSD